MVDQTSIPKSDEDIEARLRRLEEFDARIRQMKADADYNSVRAFWHPVLIGAGLLGAGAAISGALIQLFA